jgi:porin
MGLYEGDPGDLMKDPYNLDFSLDHNKSVLYIAEFNFKHLLFKNHIGTITLGSCYHSGDHISYSDSTKWCSGNYYFYLISDQELFRENIHSDEGLGFFIQAGYAPAEKNKNDFFLALGLKYTGIVPGRGSDAMGFGMAHASISNSYIIAHGSLATPSETTFELSYKAILFKHIFLQPDFQYIINPGIEPIVENACVALLRIGIHY